MTRNTDLRRIASVRLHPAPGGPGDTLFRTGFETGLPETGSGSRFFGEGMSTVREIMAIIGGFTKIPDYIEIQTCKIAGVCWHVFPALEIMR